MSPETGLTCAGEEGFEPPWTVLETVILPLYDSPVCLAHDLIFITQSFFSCQAFGRKSAHNTASTIVGSILATRSFFGHNRFIPTQKISTDPVSER